MKISLIISTYNWAEALGRVLESVALQTHLPDEILIADDGSGATTRELVERFQKTFPCPIIHVWHEDQGFRLAAIRNRAISQASGDYVVQIDGDCVLEKHFIEDHEASAESSAFCTGGRILCDAALTQKILSGEKFLRQPNFFTIGIRNRLNLLRVPALMSFLKARYKTGKPWLVKGCNMSFWREDLLKVNGYNESISGWGREDSEMAVRLSKLGLRLFHLKFGACLFHLFHKENDRSRDAENLRVLATAKESKEFFTHNGIKKTATEAGLKEAWK